MPAAEFAKRDFDFLIVGGGTAGLAVAARLSEESNLTVGVLEAGPAVFGHDAIDIPGNYGQTLGTDLDWQFSTTPQPGLGGRSLDFPRGKVIGGTSALNFMTWNRANKQDYDAWEELGNRGWGWNALLPYFKKSETFFEPEPETQTQHKAIYDAQALGASGPIQIYYPKEYYGGHALWHTTLNSLGIETNEAHLSGSNVGAWTNVCSVDPKSGKRSYSATAYYLKNASRPNLSVLTEALAEEILLEEVSGEWVAKGVRFRHGSVEYIVSASREVIVCSGSVQSPQLLELSGIGNPTVLANAGIPVKVNSPNVGENLQEHMMTAMIFEVDPTLPNPDDLKVDGKLATFARQQLEESKSGPLSILACSMCYLPLEKVVPHTILQSVATASRPPDQTSSSRQSILHRRFSQHKNLGQVEYIFDLGNWSSQFKADPSSGKKYATMLQILQHPFSVGSIHIRPPAPGSSKVTASDKPLIDPQYYTGALGHLDLEIMTECQRFAEKICSTQPLASIIRERAYPPPSLADDELRDWVVQSTITDWHPVGTCSMGGHEGIAGGVVDDSLKVYGVKGLRVVDASIIPLQISGHTQATVYAIAEKAADMILQSLE